MGLFNTIGKRQLQQAPRWIGTGAFFGGTAFVGLLFMTEWRLILDHVPYLNGKWADEKKE